LTIWPTLPLAWLAELETAELALLVAEAADELTRERPADAWEDALDATWLAVSLAFVACEDTALVASEVVEALRRAIRAASGRRKSARVAE